jgi:hypothetical protein
MLELRPMLLHQLSAGRIVFRAKLPKLSPPNAALVTHSKIAAENGTRMVLAHGHNDQDQRSDSD